jgi:hypothetical protein
MRRFLAAALVFAIVVTAGLAQAAQDKPKEKGKGGPRVAGTWKWTVTYNNQSWDMTLRLRTEKGKLTGTITRGDSPETTIQEAAFKEGQVTFTVVRERDGQKMTFKYSGKLSGDTLQGKTEFEVNGQTQSRDWAAKRAPRPSLTGTWTWASTVGGQTRERTLKLKLEKGTLSGTLGGRDGQETAIQDAKFKEGEFSFSVVRERDGQKMTSKYTGKLSGDTIKGKIEFQRDGQTQSRDWEAKRAKP